MNAKKSVSVKKLLIIIILCVLIALHVVWFVWRQAKYSSYASDMEPFIKYLSAIHTDSDGYVYNVKYPDYPSLTGNLAIATPDDSVGLIIWPHVLTGYSAGVQIEKDGFTYNIELNDSFEASKPEDKAVFAQYRDEVDLLVDRAEDFWDIEICDHS